MTPKEFFDKLLPMVERLNRETERLRRDVSTLNGRVVAFDDEPQTSHIVPASPAATVNVVECLTDIEAACRAIRGCEYDLNAIRSRLDEIAANEASRNEFRQFIQRPRR